MEHAVQILAFNSYLPLRLAAIAVIACILIFRRTRPAHELLAPLVGNMTNNIYHSSQCQYGKRIGKANRQDMFSHADALHQGFRPCKECLGPYAIDAHAEILSSQTTIVATRALPHDIAEASTRTQPLSAPTAKLLPPVKRVA